MWRDWSTKECCRPGVTKVGLFCLVNDKLTLMKLRISIKTSSKIDTVTSAQVYVNVETNKSNELRFLK
jgi:hypothetical protein